MRTSRRRSGEVACRRSAANRSGIIRFKLTNREKVCVGQIDGANRERDAEHNGQCGRNDEFESNHFVGHRWYSAMTYPTAVRALYADSGKRAPIRDRGAIVQKSVPEEHLRRKFILSPAALLRSEEDTP
jgi:hypothetical protein